MIFLLTSTTEKFEIPYTDINPSGSSHLTFFEEGKICTKICKSYSGTPSIVQTKVDYCSCYRQVLDIKDIFKRSMPYDYPPKGLLEIVEPNMDNYSIKGDDSCELVKIIYGEEKKYTLGITYIFFN